MAAADDDGFVNLYDLLGVSSAASDKEIETAYKQKARELHPDKNRDDPDAGRKFDAVKRASTVLLDAAERAAFDAALKRHEHERVREDKLSKERKELLEALRKREVGATEDAQRSAAVARAERAELERLRAEMQAERMRIAEAIVREHEAASKAMMHASPASSRSQPAADPRTDDGAFAALSLEQAEAVVLAMLDQAAARTPA